MLRVHPVVDELLASGAFALGDLVFVMRKRQIDAAGVNVDGLAEKFHGHRGTFDVPAWSSGTDGCLPKMLAGLGRFPQREIARALFFVAVVVHARSGLNPAHV